MGAADILDAASHQGCWNTDLGIGAFELDDSEGLYGLPSARTGASWIVMTAIQSSTNKKFALRIPHNYIPQIEETLSRLDTIAEKIIEKKIDWFPQYRVVRNALTVLDKELPVIVMPYIEGTSLSKYVGMNRENPKKLTELCTNLSTLEARLFESGFDHGDVSPGNILVCENGDINLIDPDSLYHLECAVSRCTELGHPSVSHPCRTPADIGPGLFIFPLRLMILIIQAIIKNPALIEENPDPNAFFFEESDLQKPANSKKFKQIKRALSKQQYDPILKALANPSLQGATEILRPDISSVSKPVILFHPSEMDLTDLADSLITPKKSPSTRRRLIMTTLPLYAEITFGGNDDNGEHNG